MRKSMSEREEEEPEQQDEEKKETRKVKIIVTPKADILFPL